MSQRQPSPWLDKAQFQQIVAATPLISLDLIVRNGQGQVLLGRRLNRPAQGYWFVPGGRVRKDESLDTAFLRLTQEELGLAASRDSARLLGHYEHFYADNFSGTEFTTHYVVLGYELAWQGQQDVLPISQHDQYQWFEVADLLQDLSVHQHTKDYFLART
ncbi:GDP-mannose mannosyl hydrolase [Aeromonas allosaccharophila]|uniref:GDP-mannose mannosyl hydrolase n=1 Tax=Aeromonas allosaccharophila TaxID=656 RepID=UPI001115D44E|nr:GDP-mannose mannosyl hydrolase [Aeromonas allosaccharophila]TNI91984.1 GDP-mannose mannosyl hydrolase [Aeromonas allosaccharophila]